MPSSNITKFGTFLRPQQKFIFKAAPALSTDTICCCLSFNFSSKFIVCCTKLLCQNSNRCNVPTSAEKVLCNKKEKALVNNDFTLLLNVKLICSEKATEFCEIFTLILTTVHAVKSKVKISQNFVAFSEYMNFIKNCWKMVDETKSISSFNENNYFGTFKVHFAKSSPYFWLHVL